MEGTMELTIKNLTKQYNTVTALNQFSYTFSNGVYGILGTNGAGKSTLMNLITDIIKRDSGEILYNGKDILTLGSKFRKIVGYMPQSQGMYESFTANRFLFYMASLKGMKQQEAKKQIDELLHIVGLYEKRNDRLKGFSGGMKQRIFLAQALLGNPEILILDEATAGLDPKERINIRNYISKIAQNRLVLLATHVVTDIECIANQVLLMKNGCLVASDTPTNLIESIQGKVGEKLCTLEEIDRYQTEYGMGNIYQRSEGQVLRLVGDNLPKEFEPVTSGIGLEDVYLYYLEQHQ